MLQAGTLARRASAMSCQACRSRLMLLLYEQAGRSDIWGNLVGNETIFESALYRNIVASVYIDLGVPGCGYTRGDSDEPGERCR